MRWSTVDLTKVKLQAMPTPLVFLEKTLGFADSLISFRTSQILCQFLSWILCLLWKCCLSQSIPICFRCLLVSVWSRRFDKWGEVVPFQHEECEDFCPFGCHVFHRCWIHHMFKCSGILAVFVRQVHHDGWVFKHVTTLLALVTSSVVLYLAPEVLLWWRACLTQAPVFIVCLCRNQASQDGCDCRYEAFHYYECDYHWDDSCHFLLTGLCRCKNELGLRLVGLQFDLLSSIVSKPEFFRVGLIDTDKSVGGDRNLTTKVTFLSTYPFPWLVAWSVFSWVSVTT